MDKWQAFCGELLTFQTSGARQQADEARAMEADLKGQLAEAENRSRELEAKVEKTAKAVTTLESLLRCEPEPQLLCCYLRLPRRTDASIQDLAPHAHCVPCAACALSLY